ncbi:MAG: sugar transferase [Lentisphaerae bacterium]|nr:sugar transferase [Lentisphaerota bacterium]
MSAETGPEQAPQTPARKGRRQEQAATSAAFREELLRERARSDRTEQVFSVVMFEVPRSARGNALAGELSTLVPARMRATDFMGWFDRGHLAVILDSCLVCSALSFGNEICRRIGEKMRPPRRIIVQTFPAQFKRNGANWHPAGAHGGHHGALHCAEGNNVDGVPCDGPCPEICLQKIGFLPGTITVEYETLPGIELRPAVSARGLPRWKRGVDVAVSLLALVLSAPVMLLAFLGLRLSSRESALFRQERVGYLGRPFMMLKFRTMSESKASTHREAMRKLIQDDASEEPMVPVKEEEEKRVTSFGRFLRKTGIDELPQLANVLRGEMSLVGPRPPIPYEVEVYQRWHHGRLDAVPGMTGLWQVSGMNRLSFKEMARLDIYYARNMSPWMDLRILIRTPLAVLNELLWGNGRRGRQGEGAARENTGSGA